MPVIQAYKRTKTYVHQFPGIKLVFEPNEQGDVVCEVSDQDAVERLLQTPTGFRVYGDQADEPIALVLTEAVAILPVDEADSKYVLRDDESGTVLDLRPMTDVELHAFAQANGIKVHASAKGDTVRDKIINFLNSEG